MLELKLRFTTDHDEIKAETGKLSAMIDERHGEIKMLRAALTHYRQHCTHPGQQTGHNERDGLWANPCPVCGESH